MTYTFEIIIPTAHNEFDDETNDEISTTRRTTLCRALMLRLRESLRLSRGSASIVNVFFTSPESGYDHLPFSSSALWPWPESMGDRIGAGGTYADGKNYRDATRPKIFFRVKTELYTFYTAVELLLPPSLTDRASALHLWRRSGAVLKLIISETTIRKISTTVI